MTATRTTPNPGTSTRPERSSQRVARKKPLAWLPLALLSGLALLLALVLLAINAVDDDGPAGPAGDRLGEVSSNGSGIDGKDGDGRIAGTEGGTGAGTGSGGAAGGALAALPGTALVGGGGVAPAAASAAADTAARREPGTAGTVLFAEDSATLDAGAQRVIATAADGLRRTGVQKVEVLGYTDTVAGAPVNAPLSKKRADAVAAALRPLLPGVEIATAARAQADPVASNATEQGRQQNRRAAIVGRA